MTPESSPATSKPSTPLPVAAEVRVDTWLWAVRQTKSRSQATNAARAGHVKVNGATVKASAKIRPGDEVRLRVEGFDRVLRVTHPLTTRVGASLAQSAYDNLTPERPRMIGALPQRERGAGRPTKKERRELDRLRGWDSATHLHFAHEN